MSNKMRVALWTDFDRYRHGTPEYARVSQTYYALKENGVEVVLPKEVISLGRENPDESDLEAALEKATHLFIINSPGLERRIESIRNMAEEKGTSIFFPERSLKNGGPTDQVVRDFLRFHMAEGNYELPPQAKTPYLGAWK